MASKPAPHCKEALVWLKNRGWSLAPLTGQDVATLTAIAHCWLLWTRGDERGQQAAIDSVAALLDGCQEICWPMARELVAQAGDWSHREPVWKKVCGAFNRRIMSRPMSLEASGAHDDRCLRLGHCHEGLPLVYREGAP